MTTLMRAQRHGRCHYNCTQLLRKKESDELLLYSICSEARSQCSTQFTHSNFQQFFFHESQSVQLFEGVSGEHDDVLVFKFEIKN